MDDVYLPVYLVSAVAGEPVGYFEPWWKWLAHAPVFDLLGCEIQDLVVFEDSVTVGALHGVGECVLCVFDSGTGDMIALADGGLVAAVREVRF